MPSARIDRPNLDASDSRTLKRARLLSHRDGTRLSPTAAVDDRTGLPAALAASAIACKVPKFLRSLYAILQTEDPHIIAWVQNKDLTPNRVTAFYILEMERFEREILPKYFKHQKFASFQRQLNNFGFRKWTKTQSSGVCTFSHNCFPPDLSAAMPCNMSIRDQWRQKSSQVQPSIAAGGSMDSPLMKRGFVSSSGIATAKAQHLHVISSSVSRRRPVHVQVPGRDIVDTPSPFGEMYRSPNSTASVDSSAFRHHLSHQPPLKKLARPHVVKQETSDLFDGLEAFCDDSFKQVVLPPLQPHFLQAATPRSSLLSASLTSPFSIPSDFCTAQAPSGCCFPLPQVVNNPSSSSILSVDARCGGTGLKSFDMKQVNEAPLGNIRSNTNTGAADAAALQGAFLEPWMWDAQPASSGFELAPVPLEFECRGSDCKLEPEWQEISGASAYQVMNGLSADLSTTGMLDIELRHQQDRGESSNSGDCGLETLLFAE